MSLPLVTKSSEFRFVLETYNDKPVQLEHFCAIFKEIFSLKYPDSPDGSCPHMVLEAKKLIDKLDARLKKLTDDQMRSRIEHDLLFVQTENGVILQKETDSSACYIAWRDSDNHVCKTASFNSKFEGFSYCEALKENNELNLIEYEKMVNEIESSHLPKYPEFLIADLGLN